MRDDLQVTQRWRLLLALPQRGAVYCRNAILCYHRLFRCGYATDEIAAVGRQRLGSSLFAPSDEIDR